MAPTYRVDLKNDRSITNLGERERREKVKAETVMKFI